MTVRSGVPGLAQNTTRALVASGFSASLQATGAFQSFDDATLAKVGGRGRFIPSTLTSTGAAGKPPGFVPLYGLAYGLFYNKAELSCVRCHKVKGEGGEVGPDLTGIGSKQKRDYLLESIVAPNKQIAKGYELVQLTLANGQQVSGVVKSEDAKVVRLLTPEGKPVVVKKEDIEERQVGKSAMPEDVVKNLSRREVRDLVEWLASLKEAKK